ncbi:MAG: ABC transporter ATP-binding protein [Thermomicrobiales bacterium]|nr:ABC transporter ATP-binding protein [Thermomicrobiales bacterium]
MRPLLRLRHFIRPRLWSLLIAYLALGAGLFFQLLVPRILQHAIDDGLMVGDHAVLTRSALYLVLASIGLAISYHFRVYLFQAFSERVAFDIRQQLYARLQRLPAEFYDAHQTGQLMARATEDINNIRVLIFSGFRTIVLFFGMLIASSILMFRIDALLAIVAMSTMPFLLVASVKYESGVRPLFVSIQRQFGAMTTSLQENIAGARLVRAYAQEGRASTHFAEEVQTLRDLNIVASRYWAIANAALFFSAGAGSVILIWLGGHRALSGHLSVGSMVAFSTYLALFADPVRWLGMVANRFARASASSTRIFEVLDTVPSIADRPEAKPVIVGDGEVRFEGVTLVYPGRSIPALDAIDLVAGAGERIAIVGKTGSGKSSLLGLLTRQHDPTGGRITIDGQEIRDVTLASLRAAVGTVTQEPFLFSMTIGENIAFGRPDASHAEIEASARAARIHDFIATLPAGYDTEVGERGVTLSGGQKQRVAIARTLLRNPRILVLDDATSAVDPETEVEVRAALANLMLSRTTFVIAQRLESVRDADRIVVLDESRIVDQGTHDELTERDGLYRRLWEIQSREKRSRGSEADA